MSTTAKKKEVQSFDDEAFQTMFKVSGRNQIQQIAIADNKANMITAMNVAIIFLIIVIFSIGTIYDNDSFHRVEIIIPLSILLGFSLVSIVCAVLSLKPKIIRANKKGRSVLFFHNFYRKTLDEYRSQMKNIGSSKDTLYEQMLTDMYFNGLVLQRKYTLLSFAYSLFLISIALSIFSFVVLTLFS